MEKTQRQIFYFSGTGNSLAVARDLAAGLGGAKLIPIPSVPDPGRSGTAAGTIGIVFPVYYEPCGGMPLMVRRFVEKLEVSPETYLFAAVTYGSAAFSTLSRLRKLLHRKGIKLSAGFTIHMPENIYPDLARKRQSRMYETWKHWLPYVVDRILGLRKGMRHLPHLLAGPAYPFLRLIGPTLLKLFKNSTLRNLRRLTGSDAADYEKLLPQMDLTFSTGDRCNDCGICEKICPAGNIRILDGKPEWRHRCEFCLACYHWCPREAIECSALRTSLKYHHPDIKVSDMILREN